MHLWITIARYNLYSRLYRKVDRTGSWATGQEDCGCCGKQRKSSVQTAKVRLYKHRNVLSIDNVCHGFYCAVKYIKFLSKIFIPLLSFRLFIIPTNNYGSLKTYEINSMYMSKNIQENLIKIF